MADMPDLSHLTAEERSIIEGVLMRQKQEEERENEIMRRKQDEVTVLEDTIRQRSEQQKKAGVELDATCHICLKTKFADGFGHLCQYCQIRCCARCGGKVTLRTGKVTWVCILCRKKQELLSKTGQWINKASETETYTHQPHMSVTLLPDPHDPHDKRPKLERARSAAEKENQPLQRSGSQLRRQYSQQETTPRRLSSDGMGDMLGPQQQRRMQQTQQQQYQQHTHQQQQHHPHQQPYQQQHQPSQYQMDAQSGGGGHADVNPNYPQNAHHSHMGGTTHTSGYYPAEDPKFYQGELDGLMRQHPHLVHPRQQKHYVTQQQQQQHHPQNSQQHLQQPQQQQQQQQPQTLPPQPHLQQQMHLQQQPPLPHQRHPSSLPSAHATGIMSADGQKKHKRPIGGPYLAQQRSFSSSEEELRSTSEYEVSQITPYEKHTRLSSYHVDNPTKLDVHHRNTYNRTNHNRQPAQHKLPTIATTAAVANHHHHQQQQQHLHHHHHHHLNQLHNSAIVEPPLIPTTAYNYHQPHRYTNEPVVDSSSSSHWSSGGGGSAGGVSSIGGIVAGSGATVVGGATTTGHGGLDELLPTDNRKFTERRKKTVRFDGPEAATADDWLRWDSDRQGSQDSATKDSGIETSSTFTSSEDSNRGDGPKHPVSWQMSSDGTRMIGHMILRKNIDGDDILGLKLLGGRLSASGRRGAFVERVKQGSIAEQEGLIQPGDEVIEWNGRALHGRSGTEVADIVFESRPEPQVELIVSRVITTRHRSAHTDWLHPHRPCRSHEEVYDRRDKPSVLVTSPGSPDLLSTTRGAATHTGRYANHLTPGGPLATEPSQSVGGRIQIKLGYEPNGLQLIVTIIGATGLLPRLNGAGRNAYVKIYLLPDRTPKSKRRTKTLHGTTEPRWGELFKYTGFRRADLNNRFVQISAWDYSRNDAHDFLGEVLVDVANHPLDDEAEWYTLQPKQEFHQLPSLRRDDPNDMEMILTPTDHLSPPSTTSRLSDSDTTSECDIDGIAASRDGASISSLGSSSSPPPEMESSERRSRRDMSPQGRKRATAMVGRETRTVSGIGHSYYQQQTQPSRNGTMSLSQRSHSAAPSENYRSSSPTRGGSLTPPDDQYGDYSAQYSSQHQHHHHHQSSGGGQYLTQQQQPPQQLPPFNSSTSSSSRFQSRSATATPTGSPKKRQLPQVPHSTSRTALRERLVQDFEERGGVCRTSRHRVRQTAHQQHQHTYRSTGMGGWERHYAGLSDSDLTMHSLEPRLRPRHSLSPDKDFMGDFGDSDMESVVSVTSSAFSTQSERPHGSRGLRAHQHQSLPCESGWSVADVAASKPAPRKLLTARCRKGAPSKIGKPMNFSAITESVKAQLFYVPVQSQSFLPPHFLQPQHCPSGSVLDVSTARIDPQIYRSNSFNIVQNHPIYACLPATSAAAYCEPVQLGAATACAEMGQFCYPTVDEVMTTSLPDPNAFHLMSPPQPGDVSRVGGYNEIFPLAVSDTLKAMKMSTPASSLQKLALPHVGSARSVQRSAARMSRVERWRKTQSTISHDQISDDDDDNDAFPLFDEDPIKVVRRKSRTRLADDFRTQSLCLPQSHLDRSTLSLDVSGRPVAKGSRNKLQRSREQTSSNRNMNVKSMDHDRGSGGGSKVYDSSNSIKAIIDDVRAVLLGDVPVHQQSYLSDEADDELSKTLKATRNESAEVSRLKISKKDSIEGTTHHTSTIKTPLVIENVAKTKTIHPELSSTKLRLHGPNKSEMFSKCRSFSNSTVSDGADESGSDDVFVESAKRSARYTKRRSSSLDALSSVAPFPKLTPKSNNNRNSTVSINNKPEYFEYLRSPVSPVPADDAARLSATSSPANSASLFPNAPAAAASSHGVALLRTRPSRGSLKKSSNKSLNATDRNSTKTHNNKNTTRTNRNSSEYDVRDRGRGRNGGRDAYTRHRGGGSGGGGSDRETDRLSDRDQGDMTHRGSFNRSLSNAEGTMEDKIDGSQSDTAVVVGLQNVDASRRKLDQRSPKSETPSRDRERFGTGMGKKSSSTSQLSATDQGTSQRKRASAGSIQRSVEVSPVSAKSAYPTGSLQSISSSEGSLAWSPSLRMADGGALSDFIDGLGPGQLVGRQVLGASALGDIQLSMCHQKGFLEVEVIRARGLQHNNHPKGLPAPYVKVYLCSGKRLLHKAKTNVARKTLDPLYQQQLPFREPFAGCILQVTVWGEYGRLDKKLFMGMAQIMLDDLNLSNIVIGWYKLFGTTSLVSGPPSLGLSRRSSISSLDSLKL